MEKLLIFDWGRTLYDPETKDLFPGVIDMLQVLKRKYNLAIVCLATDGDFERRRKVMRESDIENLFSGIYMAEENKDELYERVFLELKYTPTQSIIIDDRVVRGIAWGAKNGAETVWVRNGKFSEELPSVETGYPSHTISRASELIDLL